MDPATVLGTPAAAPTYEVLRLGTLAESIFAESLRANAGAEFPERFEAALDDVGPEDRTDSISALRPVPQCEIAPVSRELGKGLGHPHNELLPVGTGVAVPGLRLSHWCEQYSPAIRTAIGRRQRSTFMTRSAQEVVEAHLAAVAGGDMVTILRDYRDDVVMLTPQGVLEGPSGVQTFFTQALTALPGLELSPKSVVYARDVALLLWTATSTEGRVNDGVDTYVVEDGAIKFETVSFSVEPA